MPASLHLLVVIVIFFATSSYAMEQTIMKTFDGASTDLKATKVVPTLETQIKDGSNAVWCSSFLAAWKSLEKDIAGQDISLEGSPQISTLLNKADDPRPYVPAGSMYVAAGWRHKGVTDRIIKELKAAFPFKEPPKFPDIRSDSFVAYAYLEANVKFTIPYFQNRKPLEFTDSNGRKTKVASFGIRPEDDYAYNQLRSQPHILFCKGDPANSEIEFAVDLCADSSPSQIIIARIKREPSLRAALQRIEKEVQSLEVRRKKDPGFSKHMGNIGPNDVLLVPDFFWQISHHFAELEGRTFLNPTLKGQRIDIARQDISFRLDRSGAELKSESKMYCMPIPTHFLLDRPFLIFMRKKGAAEPYFAMWIDNGELLTPWKK